MTTSRLVAVVVVVAALFRLPFLTVLPSPDEAGLLLVAGQWHDGSSLYGDYWVDRPPVLLTVFELAAALGGVVALRVLGIVAVAATIVLCALTAGRLAGSRAAVWAAVAAAVLTASPWLGADRVNGELLAAPWVAATAYAAVRAVESPHRARWALLAGACVVGAVGTKQNHVEGGVLLVSLVVASALASRLSWRAASRVLVLAAAGALVALLTVVGWAWARGTAPADLFDAVVSFRIRAAEVLSSEPSKGALERRWELLGRAALAGQLLLVALVLVAPWLRRFRSPAAVAVVVPTLFAGASIVLGGSWWNHYLVQLAVPVAVGVGLVAARTRLVVPLALAYAVVAAITGVVVIRPALQVPDAPVAAGRLIAQAAHAGDSVVHAWGRPDLVWEAGLASPYEQLWSLPVRTDDRDLAEFGAVLAGPDAPTWLVMRGTLAAPSLRADEADRIAARRYRPVAKVCGLEVMLRRDVERSLPAAEPEVDCKPSALLR